MTLLLGIFIVSLFGMGVYAYAQNPTMRSALLLLPWTLLMVFVQSELLGRAKPDNFEWRTSEPELLTYYLKEPNQIFLWVLLEGEPRSYVLPWDRDLAERLNSLNLSVGGRPLIYLRRYELSTHRFDLLHEPPVEMLPPKKGNE